jgi:hypothetical protein
MAATQGGFLANLGRIYALYTGTFIGFTIFIGLLELLGESSCLFHSLRRLLRRRATSRLP